MNFRIGTTRERMKQLLDVYPDMRDDKWLAMGAYKYHNWDKPVSEESISRAWRYVQQHNPELRGKGWKERQHHNTAHTKMRCQEGPEDVSNIFDPINFKKETWFQFLIRKIFG